MAPPRDLREWIALLEREGELVRVDAEVDPDLEITEIVVDDSVDVHESDPVFVTIGANVDPKRDVLITEGPLDHLDHAPTRQFYGGKIGIDATHKGLEEGTREWPELIEMSPELKERVDTRWAEYGIAIDSSGNGRGGFLRLPRKARSTFRGS